jgi:hypothetical protein
VKVITGHDLGEESLHRGGDQIRISLHISCVYIFLGAQYSEEHCACSHQHARIYDLYDDIQALSCIIAHK